MGNISHLPSPLCITLNYHLPVFFFSKLRKDRHLNAIGNLIVLLEPEYHKSARNIESKSKKVKSESDL